MRRSLGRLSPDPIAWADVVVAVIGAGVMLLLALGGFILFVAWALND